MRGLVFGAALAAVGLACLAGGAMARNPGGHGGHGGAGPGWPAPGSNVCPFGFGLSCCPPNAMCVAPPTSPAP